MIFRNALFWLIVVSLATIVFLSNIASCAAQEGLSVQSVIGGALVFRNATDQIQVEILAPKPGQPGLSHNQYERFNVDAPGVVLNNAVNAQIILNEVTSTQPSVLNGVIGVLGQTADVILANPNGITCNGCGFDNVHHGVLTTGKPDIQNNGILNLNVNQGQIHITHKGLISYQAPDIDPVQIDLIANHIHINGKIRSEPRSGGGVTESPSSLPIEKINLIVGTQQIEVQRGQNGRVNHVIEKSISTTAVNAEPSFIDIGQLGSLYAQRIYLKNTAQGAGVYSHGVIQATRDLEISANGFIKLVGGKLEAVQKIKLDVAGQLINFGRIMTETGDITINQAQTIINGGFNKQGEITAGRNVVFSLNKGQAENNALGVIHAKAGDIRVTGLLDHIDSKIAWRNLGKLVGKNIEVLVADPDQSRLTATFNNQDGNINADGMIGKFTVSWHCEGQDQVTCLSHKKLNGTKILIENGAPQIQINNHPMTEKLKEPLYTAQRRSIININKPNRQGLSYNTTNRFDVSANGLILNNHNGDEQTVNLTHRNQQGQTDSFWGRNPNLGTGTTGENGPASVILFEVLNTNAKSSLHGLTEIAGTMADFILANPAGIECHGCGGLNTRNWTLTTGTPHFSSIDINTRSLTGFQVDRGTISIGVDGLSAHRNQTTSAIVNLLAAQTKIEGQITSFDSRVASSVVPIERLNIVTGNYTLPYDRLSELTSQHVTHQPSSDVTLPKGFDLSETGWLFTQSLSLLNTTVDSVIKSAGAIDVLEQLIINGLGPLHLTGITIAGKQAILNAAHIHHTGQLFAKNNLSIHAAELTNSGIISANKVTLSQMNKLTNEMAGLVYAEEMIDINTTNELINHGKILSERVKINLQNESRFVNSKHAYMQSHSGLEVNVASFENQGKLYDIGTGQIKINVSDKFTNKGIDSTISAKGNAFDFSVGGDFINQGLINAESTTQASSILLKNGWQQTGTIQTTHHLNIDFNNLDSKVENQGKLLSSKGNLLIKNVDSFLNTGKIYANEGDIDINRTGQAINKGLIRSTKDIKISLDHSKENTKLSFNHDEWLVFKNDKNASIIGRNVHIEFKQKYLNDAWHDSFLGNFGILYADQDMALTVQLPSRKLGGLYNAEGAQIRAGHMLALGRHCMLNQVDQCTKDSWQANTNQGSVTVTNFGEIHSNQNIAIQADRLNNSITNPGVTKITSPKQESRESRETLVQEQDSSCIVRQKHGDGTNCGHREPLLYKDTMRATWDVEEKFASPLSTARPKIVAQNDIVIRAQWVNNTGGTIAAKRNLDNKSLYADQSQDMKNVAIIRRRFIYREVWRINSEAYWNSCGNWNEKCQFRTSNKRYDELGQYQTHQELLESIGGILQGNKTDIATNNLKIDSGGQLSAGSIINLDIAKLIQTDKKNTTSEYDQYVFTPHHANVKKGDVLFKHNPLYGEDQQSSYSESLIKNIFANDLVRREAWLSYHRLGDGSYEKYFIDKQIFTSTGKAWLYDQNQYARFQTDTKNYALQQKTADYGLGQELNVEQQNNLTNTIVWLVKQDLYGYQDVLVPQLYLSPIERKNRGGGKIIAGSLTMNVQKLENVGEIKVAGKLEINVAEKLRNNGQIIGQSIAIQANQMEHSSIVQRYGNQANFEDKVTQSALIEAAEGDVTIKTQKDYLQRGATIRASGSFKLETGGQQHIESIALAKGEALIKENKNTDGTYIKQSIDKVTLTPLDSFFETGGDQIFKSSDTITFVGTHHKSGGEVKYHSSKKVDLQPLKLEEIAYIKETTSGYSTDDTGLSNGRAMASLTTTTNWTNRFEIKEHYHPTRVSAVKNTIEAEQVDLGGINFLANQATGKRTSIDIKAKRITASKYRSTTINKSDGNSVSTNMSATAESHIVKTIADVLDKSENSGNQQTERYISQLNHRASDSNTLDSNASDQQNRTTAKQYQQSLAGFIAQLDAMDTTDTKTTYRDLLEALKSKCQGYVSPINIDSTLTAARNFQKTLDEKSDDYQKLSVHIDKLNNMQKWSVDNQVTPSGEAQLYQAVIKNAQTFANVVSFSGKDLASAEARLAPAFGAQSARMKKISDNIITLDADDISLIQTEGDFELKGVKILANQYDGQLLLKSEQGALYLRAAETDSVDAQTSYSAGGSASIGASADRQGAGVSFDLGLNFNTSKSNAEQKYYENSSVSGQSVTLKSNHQIHLDGVNIDAGAFDLANHGDLIITSKQTSVQSKSVSGGINLGSGIGFNTKGGLIPMPNGNAQLNFANGTELSQITLRQSGVQAKTINGFVKRDLKLQGGYLIALDVHHHKSDRRPITSLLKVDGAIHTQSLLDSIYIFSHDTNAGGGFSRTGMADIQTGTQLGDKMNYRAEQLATLVANIEKEDRKPVVIASLVPQPNEDISQRIKIIQADYVKGRDIGFHIGTSGKKQPSKKKLSSTSDTYQHAQQHLHQKITNTLNDIDAKAQSMKQVKSKADEHNTKIKDLEVQTTSQQQMVNSLYQDLMKKEFSSHNPEDKENFIYRLHCAGLLTLSSNADIERLKNRANQINNSEQTPEFQQAVSLLDNYLQTHSVLEQIKAKITEQNKLYIQSLADIQKKQNEIKQDEQQAGKSWKSYQDLTLIQDISVLNEVDIATQNKLDGYAQKVSPEKLPEQVRKTESYLKNQFEQLNDLALNNQNNDKSINDIETPKTARDVYSDKDAIHLRRVVNIPQGLSVAEDNPTPVLHAGKHYIRIDDDYFEVKHDYAARIMLADSSQNVMGYPSATSSALYFQRENGQWVGRYLGLRGGMNNVNRVKGLTSLADRCLGDSEALHDLFSSLSIRAVPDHKPSEVAAASHYRIVPISKTEKDKDPASPKKKVFTATSIERQYDHDADLKNKTGIVPAHLPALQDLAGKENTVIAIRPVDPLATQLIEEGHPTKNFHIKGKSASWGPQAGMIPVDQRFSKLAGQDDQKISEYTQKVRQSIDDNKAIAIDLMITQDRLDTLVKQGMITKVDEKDNTITLTAKNPLQKTEQFLAKKQENGRYLILYNDQPVTVLASPVASMDKDQALPLTADYDLLLLAPYLHDFGPHDNVPVSDISYEEFVKRKKMYSPDSEVCKQYSRPDEFYKKADKNIGNASKRVQEMISKINQTLNLRPGKEVVHHGDDASNPTSDPESNYPATFFLPFEIDGRKIHIVNNTQEMSEMIRKIKDQDYYFRPNPLWEPDVTQVKRKAYTEALKRFNSGEK